MNSKLNILSIFSVGLHGVVSARILQILEARVGRPLRECFDVIGGTSVGGVTALGLTTPRADHSGSLGAPLRAEDVLRLYLEPDCDILDRRLVDASHLGRYYSAARWARRTFSESMTLERARADLRAITAADRNVPVEVIATFGPYLFSWDDASQGGAYDPLVWEAALGTASAPACLPAGADRVAGEPGLLAMRPAMIRTARRWAGGLGINDPTLDALAWAYGRGLCVEPQKVVIVSIGAAEHELAPSVPSEPWWDGSPLQRPLALSDDAFRLPRSGPDMADFGGWLRRIDSCGNLLQLGPTSRASVPVGVGARSLLEHTDRLLDSPTGRECVERAASALLA